MTKTLLHTCCAPCSVACIQLLRAEGIEPVSYWYNANIHTYQEFKASRDTLMDYAACGYPDLSYHGKDARR